MCSPQHRLGWRGVRGGWEFLWLGCVPRVRVRFLPHGRPGTRGAPAAPSLCPAGASRAPTAAPPQPCRAPPARGSWQPGALRSLPQALCFPVHVLHGPRVSRSGRAREPRFSQLQVRNKAACPGWLDSNLRITAQNGSGPSEVWELRSDQADPGLRSVTSGTCQVSESFPVIGAIRCGSLVK